MEKKDLTVTTFNKIYEVFMMMFKNGNIDEQKFLGGIMYYLDSTIFDTDERSSDEHKQEIIKNIKTLVINERVKKFKQKIR